MNELTTEIIAALAQKQDLDEVFRHHLEIAINQLLQTELAEFLGYERYSYAGINTVITATAVMSARLIRSTAHLT